MKIKVTQLGVGGPTRFEMDVSALEIDGIPYVPPAPEPVKRWECEVSFSSGEQYAQPYVYIHGLDANFRGKAKLGFDAHGRVWFADERAKELAKCMREVARDQDKGLTTRMTSDWLHEAAERLAGPHLGDST